MHRRATEERIKPDTETGGGVDLAEHPGDRLPVKHDFRRKERLVVPCRAQYPASGE